MALLDLGPDELLTTTRSVRKRLDFDRPVELDLVRECVEVAMQAPTGSNAQGWHFVVVTDADKRARLGEIYREAFAGYRNMPYSAHALAGDMGGREKAQQERVVSSAEYLAENLHRAPVHVIPCVNGRVDGGVQGPMAHLMLSSVFGSIIPAAWSFMLAARARGLGSAWTTLHLTQEKEAASLLGIPYDEVMQVALLPVAYTRGTDFRPAARKPLETVLHVDAW